MDAKNEGDFHESIDPGVNRLCHGFRITVLCESNVEWFMSNGSSEEKNIWIFLCIRS